MKKTKVVLLIALIVLVIAIIMHTRLRELLFYKYENLQSSNLLNEPIQVEQKAHVHFFKSGFAVSGTNTKFYTYDGKEMSLPFKPEDIALVGNSPVINQSTSQHVLINNRFVYDTTHTPFKLAYTIEEGSEGFAIRELGDMLLVILKTQDNLLKPVLIEKGDIYTINLEGMDHSHYLDASYDPVTKGFSVLTLATDTPYPSTRVFNFINGNSPQGMLSLNDSMFYKIYRTQKNVVLVGIHQLICYNIDGSIKWSINAPNCYIHQYVHLGNDLLLYFPKASFNRANTVYVHSNGEKELLELPYGLTDMQPYKDQQLIALNKNGDLVVIGKSGNTVRTYTLDVHPVKVYWSSFAPDRFYVLSRDNMLHIYALNKADSRKDGKT
ncbi:hypothetical protein KVG29_10580 [Caldicoprobacter algeriensis]|uniref:hypothetical protein n=1 Tax=Caldicoprobacter algeriensis TaxID=699281 RepID=UPI002079E388|nr:hypothetical protein [Caldicoprobacter algeriensis]MCM8901664.1 hypothetical protein [Caldicoprobacter algeriensis]